MKILHEGTREFQNFKDYAKIQGKEVTVIEETTYSDLDLGVAPLSGFVGATIYKYSTINGKILYYTELAYTNVDDYFIECIISEIFPEKDFFKKYVRRNDNEKY